MSDKPDYVYDPEDWEATYSWDDRDCLTEDISLGAGEVKMFRTLIQGPNKYVAEITLTLDDEGCPDETEIRWFDTLEAAQAAIAAMPKEYES